MSKSEYKITIQMKKNHIGTIHKEHMQVGSGSGGATFAHKYIAQIFLYKSKQTNPKSFTYCKEQFMKIK